MIYLGAQKELWGPPQHKSIRKYLWVMVYELFITSRPLWSSISTNSRNFSLIHTGPSGIRIHLVKSSDMTCSACLFVTQSVLVGFGPFYFVFSFSSIYIFRRRKSLYFELWCQAKRALKLATHCILRVLHSGTCCVFLKYD